MWVSSQSGLSSGCRKIGATTASRSAGATRQWSSWAWVSRIAFTVRPPTTARMSSTECGASMTTHSSSSPTTQMLLSTSKVSPSSENVPLLTAWSTRTDVSTRHQRTTTDRSTLGPSLAWCIFSNAASMSPMPISSLTKASRSSRPCR